VLDPRPRLDDASRAPPSAWQLPYPVVSTAKFPDFAPRAPWLGADLQTLRNVLRGPVFAPDAERSGVQLVLPLADGSGDRLAARLFEVEAARDGAPLVVLVHGLAGTTDSAYIQVTTAFLLGLGYSVLQLNLRGAGDSRPLCREQYHAGRTGDLHDALAALPAELVTHGVVVVGYSLGGNMTLKYAAEYGGLRGAVSISAPIDLAAASHRFLARRNRLYLRYLLSRIKQEALDTEDGISEEERALIPGLRSILEFDDRIVAARNGYSGAAEYYAKNNARQFLAEIALPTLLIHALDDPWIPADSYTTYPWARNHWLQPLLPQNGGHVGFHARGSRAPWHDQCLEVFLATL
jgi:predicted alpha/beta-fold hydrolase